MQLTLLIAAQIQSKLLIALRIALRKRKNKRKGNEKLYTNNLFPNFLNMRKIKSLEQFFLSFALKMGIKHLVYMFIFFSFYKAVYTHFPYFIVIIQRLNLFP